MSAQLIIPRANAPKDVQVVDHQLVARTKMHRTSSLSLSVQALPSDSQCDHSAVVRTFSEHVRADTRSDTPRSVCFPRVSRSRSDHDRQSFTLTRRFTSRVAENFSTV
jgi:hypothetical protein